ncbi:MAG: phosphotransferase family protein, partial [Gemmatimonadales bacterium]
MLLAPEADLVRRDDALPALATVLDPEAFVGALRPSLTTADVREASIRYLRYKPGTSCLVAYQLVVGAAPMEPVVAYAKAHRLDATEKLRKARRSGGAVLEDRALVISLFPNDDQLDAIRPLANADARPRLLRRLLSRQPALWAGTVRTLRYKPERRYVAQLQAPDGTRALLKVHSRDRYRRAARSAKVFGSGTSVRIPRRLGRSARYRTVVLEWLPGRPLDEALTSGAAGAGAMATVGAALAELHHRRPPPEGLPILDRNAEAVGLIALGADIGFVCPELARPARRLAGWLAARLVATPDACRATHGDFYAGQVLLDGDGVTVFDLDRAALGDPTADLGMFIAHLERDALRGAL